MIFIAGGVGAKDIIRVLLVEGGNINNLVHLGTLLKGHINICL